MTSEYRAYNPSIPTESFVPGLGLAGSMGVAACAVVVWRYNVPFCGGSSGAARLLAVVSSMSVLINGPNGAGTAASGIGWLIAFAVSVIGAFGQKAALKRQPK